MCVFRLHAFQGVKTVKNQKTSGHKGRMILLLSLLAILCIGGMELTVSYFFAPELFAKVTAPVRSGVRATADWLDHTAQQLSALTASLTVREEKLSEADTQTAGDPTISDNEPLTDPSLTELRTVDGATFLTGGTNMVVYFNQRDPEWAEQLYGTDDIGHYGCGPTSMAMVVSSLTEETVDPAQMAAFAAKEGYCAKKRGSYLSIVNGIAHAYGLESKAIDELSVDAVYDALLSGNMLVALEGPGHFTNGGHFIVLRGVTLTGKLLVADPASKERSLMEWDPQLVLDELSASRSNGAPLWVISPPDT